MKYFTMFELEYSTTAVSKGIKNEPTVLVEENLRALVEKVLDPLRAALGMPITVNSGYRNAELNRAVGGMWNSQHMKGQAADVTTGNCFDNRRLFIWAQEMSLPFDQLIIYENDAFVHISHVEGVNRNEVIDKNA